ncbi:DUF4382 domain-containing protein [Bacteroidota bacterium]
MKIKMTAGIAFLSMAALLFGACAPIPGPAPTPVPAPVPAPAPTPTPSPALNGNLQVYVTDAPPREQVTSIMVTISEVQVHIAQAEQEREREESGSDNETPGPEREKERQQRPQGKGGWISIDLSDNATTFDLLKIKGIEQYLGANEVMAGKYTQVRLMVDKIQVALGGGELQDATVPGKELKIARPFNVVAGETTALILDFEADKMVTVTGAGKIMVKPVVKLTTRQKGPAGKPQKTEEKKTEELEFRGNIDTIDGTIWTMTIDGETRTVDVSGAAIEGEPAVGLEAKVEGAVVDDAIVASEVEMKVAEKEEVEDLEFKGTIDTIDGTTWTMTIDGETRTVKVSGAEIEGEPEVGLKAEIKGTIADNAIIATKVEIEESAG